LQLSGESEIPLFSGDMAEDLWGDGKKWEWH